MTDERLIPKLGQMLDEWLADYDANPHISRTWLIQRMIAVFEAAHAPTEPQGKPNDGLGLVSAPTDDEWEAPKQELCGRCGWALSGHLRSQYGLDCPPSPRPGFRRSEVPGPSAKPLCGDWPAPCNCDDPETHDGEVPAWLVRQEEQGESSCDHEWQNRVSGGSKCTKCDLWQDKRVPQGEPCDCMDRYCRKDHDYQKQGEPSDAQVLAALNEYEAWSTEESLDMWGSDQAERMRAALRAAGEVGR